MLYCYYPHDAVAVAIPVDASAAGCPANDYLAVVIVLLGVLVAAAAVVVVVFQSIARL